MAIGGGCLWAIIISFVVFVYYLGAVAVCSPRKWGKQIVKACCLKCLVIGRVFYTGSVCAGVFLLVPLGVWGADKYSKTVDSREENKKKKLKKGI